MGSDSTADRLIRRAPDLTTTPGGRLPFPSADPGPQISPAPRSRRAVLTGAIGTLVGLVAGGLSRPGPTAATAGAPLIIGSQTNNAGTADTQLIANSSVVTFKLYQQGPGTALMGYATPAGGSTRGVYGRVDSPHGDGVQARNAGAAGTGAALRAFGGANDGVVATTGSGSGGAAVRASAAGTGPAVSADATNGDGVTATTSGSASAGLRGEATSTTGVAAGVHGESHSTSGVGVIGRAPAASGLAIGLLGESESTAGFGVYGSANSTTGLNAGVWGQSASTSGTGLFGWATSPSGVTVGVFGESTSPDGTGVSGYAESGTAIRGISSSGLAGLFVGDVEVGGTISKGAGSFKIDHPLDPPGKYLSHSFVESPDMKNIYDGIVTTDANGLAIVELPDWFAALNRDLRYQLTTIGDWSEAWIADEVHGGRFKVATKRPGTKVAWQVTGIRQDAFANAHRIEVEEVKTGVAKGKYLHPELYGQPSSASVHSTPTMTALSGRVR